jgi:hypothetical protein
MKGWLVLGVSIGLLGGSAALAHDSPGVDARTGFARDNHSSLVDEVQVRLYITNHRPVALGARCAIVAHSYWNVDVDRDADTFDSESRRYTNVVWFPKSRRTVFGLPPRTRGVTKTLKIFIPHPEYGEPLDYFINATAAVRHCHARVR